MSLTLPTPESFPAFPYSSPYSIQLDLMRHLYSSIEARKVTIVESPTGTGKTLSLLCATLTWLRDDRNRAQNGHLATLADALNSVEEPDWVLEQTIERYKREIYDSERQLEERLASARRKEEEQRRMEQARVRKRPRLTEAAVTQSLAEDDIFLPDDDGEVREDDNISPAVRALMERLQQSRTSSSTMPEASYTKIYYASRTHSQLSQLIPELNKLKFSPSMTSFHEQSGFTSVEISSDRKRSVETLNLQDVETAPAQTRTVALGSRKQLCINEELRAAGGDLDERCRELLHGGKDKRCKYLPPGDEEFRMLDFRDQILATPKDIEDLVLSGVSSQICPYFGSRKAIPQAQIVTLPYNLLLHKGAREALGIDLTDQIIVIDEAHNLISTLLSLSTAFLPSYVLSKSLIQLSLYFTKFQNRLSPKHMLHLKRLLVILKALEKYATDWNRAAKMSGQRLGRKVEGINLLEVEQYLRSSKIARKISSYSEKHAGNSDDKGAEKQDRSTTPPLLAVEAFLVALTNANRAGRITISSTCVAGVEHAFFKYQLLDPSIHFREVVDAARCMILAGGTMSPVSEFTSQLFSHLPEHRLSFFSCGHIIPPSNLRTIVLGKGPRGTDFVFKHAQRNNQSLLADLGQTVFNLVNIVPKGMVVFFPSYAFLEACRVLWMDTGLLERLAAKKKLFFEPQAASEVETILREYSLKIGKLTCQAGSHNSTGALLFAVVGAKLSEGLNFSDDLARAVVIIGLPFANLGSVELKERMNYINEVENTTLRAGGKRAAGMKDAGTELYENLCMKAVNQSIGRAIRHQKDWSSLILVDNRFGSNRIRSKLPKWISQDMVISQSFGHLMKDLATFFREKRVG